MIGAAACRDVAGARGGRWGRRSSWRGWSGSWGVRSRRGGRGASRPEEEGNRLCATRNLWGASRPEEGNRLCVTNGASLAALKLGPPSADEVLGQNIGEEEAHVHFICRRFPVGT